MGIEQKKYNSKLLLFGEYTVLTGSDALVFPFPRFYGEWEESVVFDERLADFFDFLKGLKLEKVRLNFEKLNTDISEGIRFVSNIKMGYGLGSSGALTSATYDRYFTADDEITIEETKQHLAQIECFFHGKSSGIDALSIYLNQPILKSKQEYKLIDHQLSTIPGCLFLIDSQKERKSESLIDNYLNHIVLKNERALNELVEAVSHIIDITIKNRFSDFKEYFAKISALQFDLLQPMIIDSVNKTWLNGLKSRDYFIKVLGAGGGGYYLGYTDDEAKISTKLTYQVIN